MLKGKHIIVGITGSIAAYKAASLVRLLVKEGAEVKGGDDGIGQTIYYSIDFGYIVQTSGDGRVL